MNDRGKIAPLIRAENIHKSYHMDKGTVRVLEGVSFDVGQGETAVILGKSGVGKSTFLHILGALDKPNEGKIILKGEDLYKLSSGRRTWIRNRMLGFVFQSYHLLPEMDVLENVMLPAMARSTFSRKSFNLRERAMDLLNSVGLGDRADHTPLELSGGEQQRVALARALINDPELVLADEPTGNLDDGTGGQILNKLFSMTKSRGNTLVIVTHNEAIANMCDRVYRLTDGILTEEKESVARGQKSVTSSQRPVARGQ